LLLAGGAVALLPGCGASGTGYEGLARDLRRAPDGPRDQAGTLLELLRYATLAPSGHNTQPWRFRVEPDRIVLLPDLTRRLPVVDPEDRELFISLGCAAENLAAAGPSLGLEPVLSVSPDGTVQATLEKRGRASSVAMLEAIAQRQCSRSRYDGKPVPADDIAALEQAARGPGVRAVFLTDSARVDAIAGYVMEGDRVQLADERFVDELKAWIRFSDAEALQRRDGLSARAGGNPSVPRWIGNLAFGMMATPDGQAERDAAAIRSGAGAVVFFSEQDDRRAWIETGRAWERFALRSTILGIRHAFLNQPAEVPALREQLEAYLASGGWRAQLVARFGYGPLMPYSLRRPVEAVLA
jgi:hypothetical protein